MLKKISTNHKINQYSKHTWWKDLCVTSKKRRLFLTGVIDFTIRPGRCVSTKYKSYKIESPHILSKLTACGNTPVDIMKELVRYCYYVWREVCFVIIPSCDGLYYFHFVKWSEITPRFNYFLFVVSAAHFAPCFCSLLSSIKLIWAAAAKCKWRAHLHNRVLWQMLEPQTT